MAVRGEDADKYDGRVFEDERAKSNSESEQYRVAKCVAYYLCKKWWREHGESSSLTKKEYYVEMFKTPLAILSIILILLGLLGFVSNPLIGTDALFSTNTATNWLHLVVGVVLLYARTH